MENTRETPDTRLGIYHQLKDRSRDQRQALIQTARKCGMVGKSPTILNLMERVISVADEDCPVLITGETGTGKELAAKALHTLSTRHRKPFEDLNCGAISEQLALAELFGHERGAFTGAESRRSGAIERADGGTLFLDEIGDLSLILQASLLRTLETGCFRRLGGENKLPSRFRLVSATHKNLSGEVRQGRFREDLFFRIGVIIIEVPPLRKRREDIPLLVSHFLSQWTENRTDRPPCKASSTAIDRLCAYHWPGNVRELRNVLRRSLSNNDRRSILEANHLQLDPYASPFNMRSEACKEPEITTVSHHEGVGAVKELLIGGRSLEEIKREVISFEIERSGGNISAAARALSIPRQTLHDYCRKNSLTCQMLA